MSILAARTSVPFGATPPVPVLTYTAQNQFTISNYDPTLTYSVSGGTISGSVITISSVGSTATVTARYDRGLVASSPRSMLTAAYARVLTSVAGGVSSEGCGPRPTICCPSGTITGPDGTQCGSGGTSGNFAGCSGCASEPIEARCFGLFITCWNWRWNNYSTGPEGTGYTLIGNTWGKAE